MLDRTLEPEIMDSCDEAMAYDAMDHSAVNEAFARDLLAVPSLGTDLLDLGTGTALIPSVLCRLNPDVRIMAADASRWMLEIARYNLEVFQCASRVQLHLVDAKDMIFQDNYFDGVISNTLLHHLPEHDAFFREAIRVLRPGGVLFLRDLFRPETDAEVERLVMTHGGIDSKGQQLLRQSFHAALTLAEIQSLVEPFGISKDCVRMTSDRHWTLAARASSSKQSFAPVHPLQPSTDPSTQA
jgi:ubiquinone/menaquinone biosynthesis C-methylase UbiE